MQQHAGHQYYNIILSLAIHRQALASAQYSDLIPWSNECETKKYCGIQVSHYTSIPRVP
jgi:hypothetical protein